jgi:hypothetical protein
MTEWNWDAISAFSSALGGLGVIISVAFLVYEVRRNAQAIEGATVQSLMSLERDVFATLADNADLFLRGRRDRSALTEEDMFRFDRVFASYMSLAYSGFVQFQERLIDDETWEAYVNAVRAHMVHPGFCDSWDVSKIGYPKSFRVMVDNRARDTK